MYTHFSNPPPVAATVALAVTAPTVLEAHDSSQCDTGSIQCCNNTYNETDQKVTELAGLLGIVLPTIEGHVGLDRTSILGTAASCAQQPVCCTDNTFSGLINLGCSPIDLSLQTATR